MRGFCLYNTSHTIGLIEPRLVSSVLLNLNITALGTCSRLILEGLFQDIGGN